MQELVRKVVLKRGVLIAVEGIDGAGKTTQSRLLMEKLKNEGYPAVCFHEPTEGKWGVKIRNPAKNGRHQTSLEEEMEFFYQDRIEDVKLHICPALEDREVIVAREIVWFVI